MTTNEVVDRLTRFVDDERAGAAKIGVRMIPAPAAAGLVEDVAALLALVARERTLREDAEKERKAHHAEALETIAVWRARAESAERERDEAARLSSTNSAVALEFSRRAAAAAPSPSPAEEPPACVIPKEKAPGRCFACGAAVAPEKCVGCGEMHVGTYCWPCHHKNNPGRCASPFCPVHRSPGGGETAKGGE